MSGNEEPRARSDRRALRTRKAIVEAYNHLFQHRRQHQIKVADIVAQADVGRSTFYEHYAGADAVFMEAFSTPLAVLAEAAAGRGDAAHLEVLLRHFWDNRHRARDLMGGRQGERVGRLLADLVEARLPADASFLIPRRLVSVQAAEAAVGPVRAWLLAEAPCGAPELAQAVCAAGRALLAAQMRGQAANTAFT